MDLPSAFKSEVFRPLATIMVPGAAAVAPFAVLANHYNPSLLAFAEKFPAVHATALILTALAAGMILEDLGGMIEAQLWDRLIEKETRCHASDWHQFLALAPKRDEETVGHRYLRTLTLRLKFELAFGLALVFLWFGLLWLDAVMLLWRHQYVLLLSALTLGASAYALWESYRTAWALGGVRRIIVANVQCKLEPRAPETARGSSIFGGVVLAFGVAFLIFSLSLAAFHLWPTSPIRHRGGLVTASLYCLFGLVLGLTWVWLGEQEAKGRKRGVALRVSLATALLAVFMQIRSSSGERPVSLLGVGLALSASVSMFVFARLFWVGSSERPSLSDHVLVEMTSTRDDAAVDNGAPVVSN